MVHSSKLLFIISLLLLVSLAFKKGKEVQHISFLDLGSSDTTESSITGLLKWQDGASKKEDAIVSGNVEFKNIESGEKYIFISGISGQYGGWVPPGNYRVEARCNECGRLVLKKVQLFAGRKYEINAFLPEPDKIEYYDLITADESMQVRRSDH